MEYIEGITLYDLLKREIDRGTKMGDKLLYSIMVQLLTIISYIHSIGMTHRDIKEENIILRKDGVLYLVDFGLACTYEPTSSQATICNDYAGTPIVSAPEVTKGRIARHIEWWPKADVWSAGIVFWEIAMGQETPVIGEDIANGNKQRIPPTQSTNDLLSIVIDRMLTVDPDERPSAENVLKCLQQMYR